MAGSKSPKGGGNGGATVRFGNPVNRELSPEHQRPLSHDFDNPVSDEEGSSDALRGSVGPGGDSASAFPVDRGDAQQQTQPTIPQAFAQNFLGHSPAWYKLCIISFLFVNIVIRFTLGTKLGTKLCAWAVLLEFIFTLACGLYCYPLQSGGLIVIEAFVLGLASSHTMIHEVEANLNVLLLVIFMVAAIHFLKNLLLWTFTKLLLGVESKIVMSVLLMFTTAALSAFLDALSVAAVLVSVCMGILGVYFHVVADADLPIDDSHHETLAFELVPHAHTAHNPMQRMNSHLGADNILESLAGKEASPRAPVSSQSVDRATSDEEDRQEADLKAMPTLEHVMDNRIEAPVDAEAYNLHKKDIEEFQSFLCSLLMHGCVGTALGGCATVVGEPQNLVIARYLDWDFVEFGAKMFPVSSTVLPIGMWTCVMVEILGIFGYGGKMPKHVRMVLKQFAEDEFGKIHNTEACELAVQAVAAVILVAALATHITEVGFVGLSIVILVTACNGITEEHELAHAFLEAMPFVSLLVVFFGVVAIIQEQKIFEPIIHGVLALEEESQAGVLFVVNGLLSTVSDNVFVATVFIKGVSAVYEEQEGMLNASVPMEMSRMQYEKLAVAINMGTNLPSCATPNGQAAFLFVLTSSIAPLVHLSYGKMVYMAFPYTVMLAISGYFGTVYMIDN